MKILTLQFDSLSVLSQADAAHPRTMGRLHVSQVYQSINDELKSVYNRRSREPLSQTELNNYRSMGFLFEHFLGNAMAYAIGYDGWFRPGEVECDGIIGSPDLCDCSTGELGECKATYKSYNKMGDAAAGLRTDFWLWDVQMRSYCKMMGTNRCKLFALFVNGDYRTYQPMFRSWSVTYTVQEIEENWMMIKTHARGKGWL